MFILMKKHVYFLSSLAIVILLALVVSQNKVSTLSVQNYNATQQASIVDMYSSVDGVFINVNQAANFNHSKQLNVDYVFVLLLAALIINVVNYLNYTPTTIPPPWYLRIKYKTRKLLSAWKTSNLLYKSKLLYLP